VVYITSEGFGRGKKESVAESKHQTYLKKKKKPKSIGKKGTVEGRWVRGNGFHSASSKGKRTGGRRTCSGGKARSTWGEKQEGKKRGHSVYDQVGADVGELTQQRGSTKLGKISPETSCSGPPLRAGGGGERKRNIKR